MKKRKILYVITKSNWGGAQRYVFDLATSLPKEEFEIAVLLGGTGPLKSRLEEHGIRVLSLTPLQRDVNLFKDVSVFFDLLRIFFRESPDVVHLNSSKIGGLGGLAARLVRVPKIIFTAHGWAFNENRSTFSKIFIKFLYFVTVHLSTKTIAVSNTMRRQARDFLAPEEKIVVIHNGIAPHPLLSKEEARMFIAARHAAFQEKLKVRSGVLVGTGAELHHIKGLSFLIKAASLLKKEGKKMLFVVLGEGEQREELEGLIREEGLENDFFLPGYIADAQVALKGLDIFVLPSLSEGLAYAILEAGYAGLPTVASNVGGIPEIIENDVSGMLVPPKDPQALAHTIGLLIKDDQKRLALGKNLKKKVEKKFSLQGMLEKTAALYS